MAPIGEIATVVTAKTAPFSRGMRRAKGEAKQFGRTAKTSIGGTLRKSVQPALAKVTGMFTGPMGIVGGIVAGGLALRRFGNSMFETADKLDNIGKVSARLGIGTEELSALEFAGQQTGVSMAELEKGLEKFNKRVGLAAQGSGEAAEMMEMMGIDAQKFIKIPISERLGIIAGKIEEAGTQAERAAIADRFFGRAGASSLMNLLQQGEEGIAALTDTAKNLGIAMKDEVVDSIEQANDTMNRFGNRAEGLKRQITAELMPALGIMLEDMEKVLPGKERKGDEKSTARRFMDMVLTTGKFTPMGALGWSYLQRADARKAEIRNAQPGEMYSDLRNSRASRQAERQREMQLMEQRRARAAAERSARAEEAALRRRELTVDHF